jgi:predicted TIM-barrel fold metal-dependent hydrolase
MKYQVISADNHIIEAPNTFADRLPAAYRARAPQILRGVDGGDGWSFDGKPPKNTFGLNAVAGRAYKDYKASGLTFEEILPGNYNGAAHLKDLDLDGVDAAVIFPMAALEAYTLADRDFALACLRAYNDWLLDEFCAADPSRLLGLPLVPVDDGIETTVRETERVLNKGARGVFLPYYAEHQYYDDYYNPLWQLLSEARAAATIHRTMGGRAPRSEIMMGNVDLSRPGLNVAGIIERFFSAIVPLTRLIFTGVFQRFPKLAFVAAEVNAGWVPMWVQMMEQEYERQRHWARLPLSQNPGSFVGRNVFVTTLDDFVGFAAAEHDEVLARTMLFSSDYPHSVTLWPKSKEYIARLTVNLDDNRKQMILAGNAIRAFGLA